MASATLTITYDGREAERVYARSHLHWQKALARAESLPGTAASASLNVKCVLYRTPCLPSSIPSEIDRISGFTRWRSMSKRCRRQTKQESEESFYLRQSHRIICTVSPSQGFANWDGTPHNGVALLALGWAYVFSASLAERQSLSMEYGMMRHDKSPSPSRAMVCLDYATPDERMWWKAVTAQGVGWSIAGDQGSPWGVHIQDIGLVIADASDDGDSDGSDNVPLPPPTARQAAHYLARLCAIYRLERQCSAALAAVLTFPLHTSKHFRQSATISLPQPRLPVRVDTFDVSLTDCSLPDEFEHLGYYMALSLSPRILGPSMWSIFWEPDVPCNLAGAWVQPAFSVLKPILTDAADLELLAKVLSFTRAAPLWLGVALCGHCRVVQSILPYLTTLQPYPHTIPNMTAAAWTGLPSSFLHAYPSTRYVRGSMVPRAQVWRLRHDFHTEYPEDEGFRHLPPHGWPPFGEMRKEDVELEIRGHLACEHRWAYQSWTWLLGRRDNVVDKGFIKTFKPTQVTRVCAALDAGQEQQQQGRRRIPKSELENICKLSKKVTESIFQWCCTQVERGFGDTVVQRLPAQRRTEEPHSPESRHTNDDFITSINDWLKGVNTDGLA
ncbi:hypothetical protein SPI_03418 [Niveomyces insectorum RCEF 264]|uniref:Uncharacterized protein n=1 Tax=Niveomyces insectorum RCEF 264 TaxID=1081102 RepID=A0A167W2H1_9HYPO|nr:hypothetical protein SPI_03418 [Niveomyces insectorum RCEF 264]